MLNRIVHVAAIEQNLPAAVACGYPIRCFCGIPFVWCRSFSSSLRERSDGGVVLCIVDRLKLLRILLYKPAFWAYLWYFSVGSVCFRHRFGESSMPQLLANSDVHNTVDKL